LSSAASGATEMGEFDWRG